MQICFNEVSFMVIYLLSNGQTSFVEPRLTKLGIRVQHFTKDSIRDLNHDTVELIYLLPFKTLLESDWPPLRVRLAQANRCYIVVSETLPSAEIMTAARDGAYDVLLASDGDERWLEALRKVVDSQKLWLQLYGGAPLGPKDLLIGQSTAMKSLRQAIERLGPTVASVLILGESGVGKERVASALHSASGRGPFIAVNCAAIPKELMEAELFGAEKGAYTGASKTREGLVEQAADGTLFLDESVEPELIGKFQQYGWPGNVRELKNVIDRMVILYDGPVLRVAWWDPPQRVNARPADFSKSFHSNPVPSDARPVAFNRKQKLGV